MISRRTKFVDPIRSMADIRSLRQMRDAVNALLNGSIPGGRVEYGEANTVWLPPPVGETFTLFTFVSDGGDFLTCIQNSENTDLDFQPASSGTQVKVYKPFELRTSLTTETVNGVVYNYLYALQGNQFYQRSVSGSDGSAETDVVIPFYTPTRPVWAAQDADGNWVDINRAGRAWSAINQNNGGGGIA